MHLYIGPRNGDNEATPSIQRMTRSDLVGKHNRRDRSTNEVVTRGPKFFFFFSTTKMRIKSQ